MTIKLSVLDQSISHDRNSAQQAFSNTIEMAQWCEELGYERFWVSEHHGFPVIAGSAPEILITALGAATNKIKLGAGGIMLPHYSAYKVAETFSILSNLYPDRIDLGVGRAPGTDMITARALATDGIPKFEKFPELVSSLTQYLWNNNTTPPLSPKPQGNLPVWMLGSSPESAILAAEMGLPYNLAAFINPKANPKYIEIYKQNYKPSEQFPEPYCTLTIGAFCAETEQAAQALRLNFDTTFFLYITGQHREGLLTPEETQNMNMIPELSAFIHQRDALRAVGNPQQVKEQITALAQQFDVDEIMMVSNTYHLEDRKQSYRLISEAMGK